MWDLLSKKTKTTAISILSVLFLVIYLLVTREPLKLSSNLAEIADLKKVISYFSIYWTAIYLILKHGGIKLWSSPLRKQLTSFIGPDLRGDWKATIEFKTPDGEKKAKDLFFKIEMSIFDFSMTMKSEDNYSTSKVVSSKLIKDESLGGHILYYIFESEVNNPTTTDVPTFQGAAKIRIDDEENLRGVYWTNRNWQNSRQTASFISFSRISPMEPNRSI